jgi:hypothetical protein
VRTRIALAIVCLVAVVLAVVLVLSRRDPVVDEVMVPFGFAVAVPRDFQEVNVDVPEIAQDPPTDPVGAALAEAAGWTVDGTTELFLVDTEPLASGAVNVASVSCRTRPGLPPLAELTPTMVPEMEERGFGDARVEPFGDGVLLFFRRQDGAPTWRLYLQDDVRERQCVLTWMLGDVADEEAGESLFAVVAPTFRFAPSGPAAQPGAEVPRRLVSRGFALAVPEGWSAGTPADGFGAWTQLSLVPQEGPSHSELGTITAGCEPEGEFPDLPGEEGERLRYLQDVLRQQLEAEGATDLVFRTEEHEVRVSYRQPRAGTRGFLKLVHSGTRECRLGYTASERDPRDEQEALFDRMADTFTFAP